LNNEHFIGLMTGTSLDAVDAVLASFDDSHATVVATHEEPLPEQLRNQLTELIIKPDDISLDVLGAAHRQLGKVYATAVDQLLTAAGIKKTEIRAIGCHGQTIRHQPEGEHAFTLQIGDGAGLAVLTGITVVNDFRSADVALGGQGAPLAPAFHHFAFAGAEPRVIVNLGGIANITVLDDNGAVSGFDTGPANTLLDLWCNDHIGRPFDEGGDWARSGTCDNDLLDTLLAEPFFALPPPKSTGREHFNRAWLQRYLDAFPTPPQPADVQATLSELTARVVTDAIARQAPGATVYLSGGGAYNSFLAERIAANLPGGRVATTAELGIPPAWVEATAFAWLARARLCAEPGNLPDVTGASRPAVLGAIHTP